ncbi:MAG: type II toxin-antitoxin system RelE/ParE family toxin [Cyclobacteriaceae bacterium]|nr:MAG: type II toxin-antitoxin system RelE/ParE family toxin [Cyclobacteriaceae bacterium]
MAKQVIWSTRAQNDRKQILEYWRSRNKSNTYSKKLDQRFREAINIIRDYSQIGKQTDDQKVRIKIVKDYLLVYEETSDSIIVLTIWDSRQDPKKLEKILKS